MPKLGGGRVKKRTINKRLRLFDRCVRNFAYMHPIGPYENDSPREIYRGQKKGGGVVQEKF